MVGKSPLSLRRLVGFAILCLVVLGALALKKWRKPRLVLVEPLTSAPFFFDGFSGRHIDPMKWQVTDGYQSLQLTQWGHVPDLKTDPDGTNFARVSLATYNPNPEKSGKSYLGTQFHSWDRWKVGTGIEYEARLRFNRVPRGLVLGFFAYGDAGVWQDTYQKTETDFEFLSLYGGRKIWLHIWDNWNPLRKGSEAGNLYSPGGINWNDGNWNDFRIRWYPDRTEWIVNNAVIRTETEVRPGSPMGVWFNAWGPASDWLDAYDASLQPAKTPAENQIHSYDVDYVAVRRIPPAPPPPIGQGVGLQGNYYDTDHFSQCKFVRLDPRVDFDWASFPPDTLIHDDPFSVRWTGFIEPQYSQEYTFTANGDDGVRLWIDGQKVLDDWTPQRPHLRTGKIRLVAGQKVPIRLDYYHRAGHSTIQLFWSCASTPQELIPQSQLSVFGRPSAPEFSLSSRTLTKPQEVKMTSATPGATIHYTLDGTTPTTSSPALKSGSKIRVTYTSLVRAGAFLPNRVPSPISRVSYVLDDNTAPRVVFTSPSGRPSPGVITPMIFPITGRVWDGGSGVARIDMVITRLSDGLRWKQGKWVDEEWGLSAKIVGSRWSVKNGLPRIRDLSPGDYELKAVAYDRAGNIAGSVQNVRIDVIGPPLLSDVISYGAYEGAP